MPKFKEKTVAIFETRVAGIPCQIAVTDYDPYDDGCTSGPADNWYPPEGGGGDYRILDRKGYLAEWLERKAEALKLDDEIQQEIFEHMENKNRWYHNDEPDYDRRFW